MSEPYLYCELDISGFKYPALLSSLGCLFSAICSAIVFQIGLAKNEKANDVTLRLYLTKIMPIGFSLAATLVTGNQAYLYLSVSFIQVSPAGTLSCWAVLLLSLLIAVVLRRCNR